MSSAVDVSETPYLLRASVIYVHELDVLEKRLSTYIIRRAERPDNLRMHRLSLQRPLRVRERRLIHRSLQV